MARRSSILRLPPEIRTSIGALWEEGHTLDQILEHLGKLRVDVEISRSALGRHTKHLAKMGERLGRSRIMAEGLARELGEKSGEQVARLNIELLHSFVNDMLAEADEDTDEGRELTKVLRNPKGAAAAAEAIERLTKASRHNQEFVEKIEKRATEKAHREAAQRVEKEGKAQGLTKDTVAKIKASVFGVKA